MDNKKVAKSFFKYILWILQFLQFFAIFCNFCNFLQKNPKWATFGYPKNEQLWITLDNFWITKKLLVFTKKNAKKCWSQPKILVFSNSLHYALCKKCCIFLVKNFLQILKMDISKMSKIDFRKKF